MPAARAEVRQTVGGISPGGSSRRCEASWTEGRGRFLTETELVDGSFEHRGAAVGTDGFRGGAWLAEGKGPLKQSRASGTSSDPKPAAHDWRYTRWGMSPEEVKVASRGTARPAGAGDQSGDRSQGGTVLLTAPVTWGDLAFKALFAFDLTPRRLSSVTPRLEKVDPNSKVRLVRLLNEFYGRPFSGHRARGIQILVWRSADTQIAYTDLGPESLAPDAPATSVNYQPFSAQTLTEDVKRPVRQAYAAVVGNPKLSVSTPAR